MHGIVHKTLKEYVIDTTDRDTWTTLIDRTNIEPKLYLPVSNYDDAEIDAILAAFSELQQTDRDAVEREFGRYLAPELLSTFDAHVRDGWGLFELLANIETVTNSVSKTTTGTTIPEAASELTADHALITYRSQRDYCKLAHGVLEGTTEAFGVDTSVSEESCIHDGDPDCTFSVERV